MFIETSKTETNYEFAFEITAARREKWLPGNIIEKRVSLFHIIASNNGKTRRHIDQLRPRTIIKATYRRPDPVMIVTSSIKETHTRNDPGNSNTRTASAVAPTDDKSRILPSLHRPSSRDSLKDQKDHVADLSNQ